MLKEQYMITSNTFQFQSTTSNAKNASFVGLSLMEAVKNQSKNFFKCCKCSIEEFCFDKNNVSILALKKRGWWNYIQKTA